MKVFITGGSGFLGINLVRYLMNMGVEVVSYDIAEFDYPERDSIKWILGDVRDKNFMKQSMDGCTHVVHCAAALPLYSREDIYSTDVGGCKNVLLCVKELNLERVVQISSTAVYGVPDHHPIYETDRLFGVGDYGTAKIMAEEGCVKAREDGLTICILRPKSFIGPERLGVFALLYDWAKDGRGFPVLGNGKNRYQLLDVEDMCTAIWLALTKEKETVNDVFNIGAAEFDTMKNDFQSVLDKAGHGKKIKCLPAGPAVAILKLLEMMKLSPLYKWVYDTASTDSFVSIEKAQRILGFAPKYSNKDALIRNYEWYLANIDSFADKTGVSHRVPWSQGVLKIAKKFF